ncbi:MAG: YbhN family protein [Propionibacteriaceae bacterium]|jgi:uncharacterized protein (TIRG00374 family)|nr:YbhN family protein [Propionibacteriaceae bacterium]
MSTTVPPESQAVVGQSRVGVWDDPRAKVRNPSDLIGVIGCGVSIILVCLMVVYAHNTTAGITADVRSFAVLLQRILFVPVAVLDMIVILFPPVAIGIELLVRRHPMAALQGLIGAIGGILAGIVIVFLIRQMGPDSLVQGLSVRKGAVETLTIPTYVAAITALLTSVATPASRRSISWSWNLLWISVVVAVVTTADSLPGMAIALLAGRLMGYVARYAFGVASQRAYGQTLVDGVCRAGFSPVTLDRVGVDKARSKVVDRRGRQTPQFFLDHRLYVVRTMAAKTYNIIVLDGDRQVMSILTRGWRYLRSRAVEGRTALSLRQTAERSALLSYAVRSAGVATPAVLAIAEAEDSMLIIREATRPSVCFADLTPDQVTDDLVDEMWRQILSAHRCGIAHRALTPQCFRVAERAGAAVTTQPVNHADTASGADPRWVWVLGWESGDVASSQLARRIDLTQMIALIAALIGPARALASARRAVPEGELAELGPLMQIPAIPKPTRDRLEPAKEVLAGLRTELTKDHPSAPTQTDHLTRIGVRSVVMTILVTVAIIIVLTSFNLPQVVQALRESDWRWAVAAFVAGLVGYAGAAVSFLAFSPVKIPFWKAYLGQVASSFVALAAPAGIGPAAINLRLMTRRQVPTAVAAATAALTQVANVVVVVASLVVLTVATGSSQLLPFEFTPSALIAVLLVVVAVGVVMVVPRSRTWVLGRVTPLLHRTWPRLVELLSSPYRLAIGLGGNVVVLAAYITAFQWAVYAFGRDLPFLGVAMAYLIATSAGSIIPTPGGMGTIEVTEAATLASLGLNAGVAASIVLLFRLVTYWLRVPIGWVAYRWMTRHGEL